MGSELAPDLLAKMEKLGQQAVQAARVMGAASPAAKSAALNRLAALLRE